MYNFILNSLMKLKNTNVKKKKFKRNFKEIKKMRVKEPPPPPPPQIYHCLICANKQNIINVISETI